MTHPLAGKPPPSDMLVDVERLLAAYVEAPDPSSAEQRVAFGTSGHRGSSLRRSFNEAHIIAISRAIAEQRRAAGIDGPLFLGIDTHALSVPARDTALAVFAAEGVEVRAQANAFTPTPAVSFAILEHNRDRGTRIADGVVITPSHNPPDDGGFKYNPPHGGPADADVTKAIEARANELLEAGVGAAPTGGSAALEHDFVGPYVDALGKVVDMEAIAVSGLKIGVDPMGGSGLAYWGPIAARYNLDVDVVNDHLDPTFSFMRVDKDGKIRMDCSSRFAMAGLVELRDQYDIAFGNDTDYDRHGIVTPTHGLLNPNHYLAAAIDYLLSNRPHWPASTAIGKTLVSSSIIDRVVAARGRRLVEVPVGFKWFVDGLLTGGLGFGGEESAGASFLRSDGSPWTTDKDGIILDLLAAEITARTGKNPGELYDTLTGRFGAPIYERLDAPATPAQKAKLKALSPEQVTARELAGDPITARLTRAPGNDAPIGGLKVTTANGWFAARPSGTENVYKIYTESFVGSEHLVRIQDEARAIVARAIG